MVDQSDSSVPEEIRARGGHECMINMRCKWNYGVCCEGGLTCCATKCLKHVKTGAIRCQFTAVEEELERERLQRLRDIQDELWRQEELAKAIRREKKIAAAKAQALAKLQAQLTAKEEKKKKDELLAERKARRAREKQLREEEKRNQDNDKYKRQMAVRYAKCRKQRRVPPAHPGSFDIHLFRYPYLLSMATVQDAQSSTCGLFSEDKRADHAWIAENEVRFLISMGNGSFYTPHYLLPFEKLHLDESFVTAPSVDLDGDGRSDLLRMTPERIHTYFTQGNDHECFAFSHAMPQMCFQALHFDLPKTFHMIGQWQWPRNILPGFPSPMVVGDFNGDGLQDIARLGARSMRLFISRGDGRFGLLAYKYPAGVDIGWDQSLFATRGLDLDGNCRTEIIAVAARYVYSFFPVGTVVNCFEKDGDIDSNCFRVNQFKFREDRDFCCDGTMGWNSRAFITGDFNGDHSQDFAHLAPQRFYFFISKGNGEFFAPEYGVDARLQLSWDERNVTTLAGDFDGDARSDIIRTWADKSVSFFPRGTDSDCWHHNGQMGNHCMFVASQNYTAAASVKGRLLSTFHSHSARVGDVNADGKDDYWNPGLQQEYVYIAK